MLALFSSVDKVQRFDGVRAPRSWGARFTGMLVFTACLAFVAALPDLLKFLGSWKHAWKVLVPALLVCVSLHAQTANKIAPDCPIVIASRSTTGTSSVYDNRPQSGSTSPCTELIFTASATTTNSSFTIAVEGAQDNGAASCAGCSWSTLGSLTLSAEGTIKAPTGTYADYIRINLSAITGGSVSGVLTGWRPNQSTVAGGGGGGGMCPGGSATEIQVTDGTMCVGFADFVWNEVATGTGMTGLQIGLPEPDLSCCDGPGNSISITENNAITYNYVTAGSEVDTLDVYYTSGGTVASPTDIIGNQGLWYADFLGYLSGAYQYFGTSQVVYNGFGGAFDKILFSSSGGDVGRDSLFSPDGTIIEYRLNGDSTGSFGWTPLATGEAELNGGLPVSSGGFLAQLDLATALIGSNDSAALAAFQSAVTNGTLLVSAIGDGSSSAGESLQYGSSDGDLFPTLYWATSHGTFSAPTNSTNSDILGSLLPAFYNGGWQIINSQLYSAVDDISLGSGHFLMSGSWEFGTTGANQALVTDSNNFVTGIAGFSGSGTACAITAITDGIITAATCT